MNFYNTWILHFLWILPIVGLLLYIVSRRKERALSLFADQELLPLLTGKGLKGRGFVKNSFLLIGAGLMIFALAGPRWGSFYQEVSRKGVDIVIVLDVSQSMMVEDIKPSRLERAKREIYDFLQVVTGDRIGLVAFAGAAFIQCPLTLDYAALNMFLESLTPDLIPVPGTDLGAAIEMGMSAFDFESETDKVIFLITDGEDNEEDGLKAAKVAAKKGVKIFLLGMGENTGGPIPEEDNAGGFKKDSSGKLILSKLDEESLRKIADITGGRYVRSLAGDLDLDLLYFEGIKLRTEAVELKSGKIKVFEERFMIFLIAAILFLLLEGLILERQTV